ncbi:hypothetical protein CS542_08650 [Pedobacter sp. IW39]|nr:hypothetical protein CS542_08650 [Pedobacter sp. IW39]
MCCSLYDEAANVDIIAARKRYPGKGLELWNEGAVEFIFRTADFLTQRLNKGHRWKDEPMELKIKA